MTASEAESAARNAAARTRTSDAYEYEVGERVELKEYGEWLPATVEGRFIGPASGWPIYVIAGASDRDRYRYACDLRPVPQSLRVKP